VARGRRILRLDRQRPRWLGALVRLARHLLPAGGRRGQGQDPAEPAPGDHNPKGLPERSIKEVRLFEYGPVTFPAYANTTPGLRSLTDNFVFDWLAREPERARELVGATDLSRAALAAREEDAPSTTDAAPDEGTSAPERRDTGRYGLTTHDQRPTWAL
jgi:hypothetical protein